MSTLSTLPTYAAPGREAKVIFTLTQSGTNFVRVWVTKAPAGSDLRKKLDKTTQNRFPVYNGEGGSDYPWRNTFDIGGKYTLVAQEYTRGATAYGGGYKGSPDGDQSETKVGSESTLSLFIGQRLTSEIKAEADRATVVLWVWNDSIRETTLELHGEQSPAIQLDSPTPRALAASEDTSVTSALTDLIDLTVTSAVGDMASVLANLIAKWNAHLTQSGVHNANDTLNAIPVGLSGSVSSASIATALSEILPKIRYHYSNDIVLGGVSSGRDTGGFHDVSGKKNDAVNLPIISGASDLAGAYWMLADLCRAFEGHRPSVDFHDVADSGNDLTPRPALMALGEAFLSVVASTTPLTPPTQSSGAMKLIAAAGFEEKPL